ncbi:hypothetical protein GGX14DRAFT_401261 [Mycena pura]|uniref:Uncharacterized protein n=1 Tax=Mycena pura TaxID=153505 RepID=A0AAD6V823_9AGAR|nr:hypothetical protein GGX14DRAFT_401261 [Mycena pura]
MHTLHRHGQTGMACANRHAELPEKHYEPRQTGMRDGEIGMSTVYGLCILHIIWTPGVLFFVLDALHSMNATARAAALVRSLAVRFNLSVIAFGERILSADAPGASGALVLCAQGMIDPAPVMPPAAPPFRLLTSTIRAASASGAPAAPHRLPSR